MLKLRTIGMAQKVTHVMEAYEWCVFSPLYVRVMSPFASF